MMNRTNASIHPEDLASGAESTLEGGDQTLNAIIAEAAKQFDRLMELRDPVVFAVETFPALPSPENQALLRARLPEQLRCK